MANRLSLMIVALLAVISTAFVCGAQAATTNERSLAQNKQPDSGKKTPEKPESRKRVPERGTVKIDRAIELAATQLVDSHLPDLKNVLKHLRSNDLQQYNLAIRDLARSARKLELSKKRDQGLYDLEVELLQANSNVRLLTAKLKVRDDQSDRKRLREAVSRLHDAELQRARYDVNSLQERIKRTQKSLDAAKQRLTQKESRHKELVESSYLGYLRKAGRTDESAPSKTPSKKKK